MDFIKVKKENTNTECRVCLTLQILHPSVPTASVRKWSGPKYRSQIEKDATSSDPKVRNSPQSSTRLDQYSEAHFPEQEKMLWDVFLERRYKF